MKETETKKLIKESLLTPSDDFTDKLMYKVENELSSRKSFSWTFILACACGVILFISVLLYKSKFSPEFHLLDQSFTFHPLLIQIPITVYLLFEFNQMFEMRRRKLAEQL